MKLALVGVVASSGGPGLGGSDDGAVLGIGAAVVGDVIDKSSFVDGAGDKGVLTGRKVEAMLGYRCVG